jgi:hypothetical protein
MSEEIKILFGVGSKIPTSNTLKRGYIEVMAIVDNYVMFRRNSCMPMVKTLKDFGIFVDNNCIQKKSNTGRKE